MHSACDGQSVFIPCKQAENYINWHSIPFFSCNCNIIPLKTSTIFPSPCWMMAKRDFTIVTSLMFSVVSYRNGFSGFVAEKSISAR